MNCITTIKEKNPYRSTSTEPVIYKLEILCEGTYDEVKEMENKFWKIIKNNSKWNEDGKARSIEAIKNEKSHNSK